MTDKEREDPKPEENTLGPNESGDEEGMPRRRRRAIGGGDDSSGTPSPEDAGASGIKPDTSKDAPETKKDPQTPSPAGDTPADKKPSSPEPENTALPTPDEAKSGSFPRRRRDAVPAPMETGAPSPSPLAQQKKQSAAPAAGPQDQSAEKADSKSPEDESKRKLRLVILVLLLVIGAAWMMMLLGTAAQQAGGGVSTGSITHGPAPAPEVDTSAGDAKAGELALLLKGGDHKAAMEKAKALRDKHVESVALQTQAHLAEAVGAVLANAATLDELPLPEPANESLPVMTNVERQEARIPYLSNLANYRRDWGDELLSLPEASPVFEKYNAEIAAAIDNVRAWRSAAGQLARAREAAESSPPNLTLASTLMRAAATQVPVKALVPVAEDAANVASAEKNIEARRLDDAVEDLGEVSMDASASVADEPKTALDAVRKVVKERLAAAKKRVGAWGELQDLMTSSRKLHEDGKTAEALKQMEAMLASVDRTNPLTRELIDDLEKRQKHYTEVLDAFTQAMQVKANEGLKEQLQAWGSFQGVIDRRKDRHYFTASIEELKIIKETIQKRIAAKYDELIEVGAPFKKINARMRRPESPRKVFADQAVILKAMAEKAEEIIEINNLVASWRLGDTTEDQVSYAKNTLADHADQSQTLWNLAMLYRDRGRLPEARECAQRVLILGDVGKNPWYDEARKWIEGGAKANEAEKTASEGE